MSTSSRRPRSEKDESRPPTGVYCLCFVLEKPVTLDCATLGRPRLGPGIYLYAGSAQRGLRARLARHFGRPATRYWHVDCLTAKARPVAAACWPLGREAECRLAAALGRHWPAAVRRFGVGDCRCQTHLFGPADRDWLAAAESALGPAAVVGRAEVT